MAERKKCMPCCVEFTHLLFLLAPLPGALQYCPATVKVLLTRHLKQKFSSRLNLAAKAVLYRPYRWRVIHLTFWDGFRTSISKYRAFSDGFPISLCSSVHLFDTSLTFWDGFPISIGSSVHTFQTNLAHGRIFCRFPPGTNLRRNVCMTREWQRYPLTRS